MVGKKLGQTIVLAVEPKIPDGTEVEVLLPDEWQAQRDILLSVGYHPDFHQDIGQAQQQWNPRQF